MEAPARALILLTVALAGCGAASKPAATPTPERVVVSRVVDGHCPVTLPGPEFGEGFNYGIEDKLAVALWPKGVLAAGKLPDGGSYAEVSADGSIRTKIAWWRGTPGKVRVRGERLDASGPPLRAHVPDGYGSTGFQPSGLTFPTTGCWHITGSVGDARLEFVVLVRRLSR